MVKKNKLGTLTNPKLSQLAIVLICCILSTLVTAAERQGLLLNAKLTTEHDDNPLRNVNANADSAAKLAPQLQYLTSYSKHRLSVNYQGDYALYNDNDKLNYDNHQLTVLAKLEHSLKLSSEFKLTYQDEIEKPDSNNSTSLFITEFNHSQKKQATAKLYYGKQSSIGQLVFGLDHHQNRYTNNLQNYRDYDRNRISATFYYRIAPKIRLLLQATSANYDYQVRNELASQSSKENFYLAGVQWHITAKTHGTFKLGYQDKKFTQDNYDDISGLSYALDMTWKPNTYSKVKIAASREVKESSQFLSSAFINNVYSIQGEHNITPRTKLTAGYSFDTADISSTLKRTDKRNNINLAIQHSLLNWLEIKLDYRLVARKSDISAYEFTANIIGLSLTTTFN